MERAKIHSTAITVPEFKAREKHRQLAFSHVVKVAAKSRHNFESMGPVHPRVVAKLSDPTIDASDESLALSCRAVSGIEWPTTVTMNLWHTHGEPDNDGVLWFTCKVIVMFDIPDSEKLSMFTMQALMRGAAKMCEQTVLDWVIAYDDLVCAVVHEMNVEESLQELRAEQRGRAESHINVEARRAKARARYEADLAQIEREVLAVIDDHRAQFVAGARKELETVTLTEERRAAYASALEVIEKTTEEPAKTVAA